MSKLAKYTFPNTGNFSGAPAKLVPLKCTSCHNQVTLTDTSFTICRGCETKIEIPKEYRELKNYSRKYNEELDKLMQHHRSIAVLPNKLIKGWLKLVTPLYQTLFIIYSLMGLAGIFLLYFLIIYLSPVLHVKLIDIYGSQIIYVSTAFLFCALLVIPMILSEVADRNMELRQILQAAVSAKIITGTSTITFACRSCGAELNAETSRQAICCDYCETENLLIPDSKYLEELRNKSKWQFKRISEALDLHKKYREEIKLSYKSGIVISLCAILAFWIAGAIFDFIEDKDKPLMSDREKTITFLKKKNKSNPVYAKNYELYGNTFWLFLKNGEVFHFKVKEFDKTPELQLMKYTSAIYSGSKENITLKVSGKNEAEFRFTAPYTGAYMFSIEENGGYACEYGIAAE